LSPSPSGRRRRAAARRGATLPRRPAPRRAGGRRPRRTATGDRAGRAGLRLVVRSTQARRRSSSRKPCDRKRPSRRWTTRCSRCRWTTSPSRLPGSLNTTGRMGASRRHSAGGLALLRGARSVSRVAAQVGSAPLRSCRWGSSQRARSGSAQPRRRWRGQAPAPTVSSDAESASRKWRSSRPIHSLRALQELAQLGELPLELDPALVGLVVAHLDRIVRTRATGRRRRRRPCRWQR
jgi:hypothetical protein